MLFDQHRLSVLYIPSGKTKRKVAKLHPYLPSTATMTTSDNGQYRQDDHLRQWSVQTRGGTIHRCIDISRYFSRDTYRDIIFYNHNFFFFFF